MSKPYLLVGIDTEGDNQWDPAARRRQTFTNIYALPRLHALLHRHAVRPTYLVTHPVARDAQSADLLRELRAEGTCEIGAHHHAWETPPFSPGDADLHLYARQLPIDRFEQQLEALTEAIERAVGVRPVSYRSGRFGFDGSHVFALERAGYQVDSSVAPLFNERHKGGPSFVRAPRDPYFLSYDNACSRGASQVLEIPISAALHPRMSAAISRLYAQVPRRYTLHRVLRKLRLARMLWLRPSYSSLPDMQRLAGRLVSEGAPVLNVFFHSSEGVAGGSPYNRTEAELRAFLNRFDRFLAFATEALQAEPVTFSEFRTRYAAAARLPALSLHS
jgi:peptidoglycan/xylan/chitin deacetylase (PgdA/CDA1 family)